ncbi:MAG: FAD-binding protein [Armatimonadetes bacterium]|nr:FAD-binding protein [Armatimonadota bacterium]
MSETWRPEVIQALRRIAPAERVLTDDLDLHVHAYDGTPLLFHPPRAVVVIDSAEQIPPILQLAHQHQFKVIPRGSGSGLSGGSVPVEDAVVLNLTRLNRIIELDEANLTAMVEPGVITQTLHTEVEARGLFYPPDPGSSKICTLGGNVAENSGGLRGLKYGVTKDYVLGLEVVLPNGEVIWSGNKCVKDAAGYDLKHVFIGSEGTLGIFTRILLKLIPKPQARKTMVAYFHSMRAAAEAVSGIIAAHVIPATLEFLDNVTMRCVEDYAHLGLKLDYGALLLIEVDGHPVVVDEEAEKVMQVCRDHQAAEFALAADDAEAVRMAAARRVAFTALARMRPTTILEDATVPRSNVPEMIDVIEECARKYQLQIGTFGHAGDGNLHPTFLVDERDADELARVEHAFGDIFDGALRLGGTITGEHGTGTVKMPFLARQYNDPTLAMMRTLKAVLDPEEILNPGKVLQPGRRFGEGLLERPEEALGVA